MALPRINNPTYELDLPSTGEKIKFRPFLVKEQKVLMMAQDGKKDSEIAETMGQLVSSCTYGKINPNTAPLFDIEYVFLKLRCKSFCARCVWIWPSDTKATSPSYPFFFSRTGSPSVSVFRPRTLR